MKSKEGHRMTKILFSLVFFFLTIIFYALPVEARSLKTKYEIQSNPPISVIVNSTQDESRSDYGTWDINLKINNNSNKTVKSVDLQFIPQNDFGQITFNPFETTTSENINPSNSISQSLNTRGDLTTTQVLVKVRGVLFTDGTRWPSQEINTSSDATDSEYEFIAFNKMSNYLISKDLIGKKIKTKATFVGIENLSYVYTSNIQQNKNYPDNLIYIKIAPQNIKPDHSFSFAINNFAVNKKNADCVFELNNFENIEIFGEYKEFEVNYMLKNVVFIVHKIQINK